MNSSTPGSAELIRTFIKKASLKQEIYHKTIDVFERFKSQAAGFISENTNRVSKTKYPLLFELKERGEFQFELRFGSDVLIFMMHTNVFEFPRDHEIMTSEYIRQDKARSYCGCIMIFNFLADSFRYNRLNDIGYLIGRIFINRENHYFIEGKREIGLLYNNFPYSKMDMKSVRSIILSSILYTVNFDLLTPPFENLKEVTLQEMMTQLDTMSIKTGKRIGFQFQADQVKEMKNKRK